MNEFEITIESDNTEAVLKALQERSETGLEAVGLQAEGDCKAACPVDTGLLRNSITHAVSGKKPAISAYESNGTHKETDATRRAGTAGMPVVPKKTGQYDGTAPTEDGICVYIGTNVEYAPYVHEGAGKTAPRRFIKDPIEANRNTYKEIYEAAVNGEL